jgi:hypothetical protein
MERTPARKEVFGALVLAGLLALAPVPVAATIEAGDDAALAAARQLYGTTDLVIERVTNGAFAAAFPKYRLYFAYELQGPPVGGHAMAWEPKLQQAYDITSEYDALLTAAGAVVGTSAAAITYAEPYAELANGEVQLGRKVVGAGDAAWIGRPLQDPSAVATLDGWRVTLTSWASENGILADWTVTFQVGRVVEGEWAVTDAYAGPYSFALEAPNLRDGMLFVNQYRAAGHSLQSTAPPSEGGGPLVLGEGWRDLDWVVLEQRTTYDGSTWLVLYPQTASPPPADVLATAAAAADAAVFAYDRMVVRNPTPCAGIENPAPDWGFEVLDGDCVMRVYLLPPSAVQCGGACPLPGTEVEILVRRDIVPQLQSNGYYVDPGHDLASAMRVVIGHELFHSLQWVLSRWFPPPFGWSVYRESQARLAQTLLDPATEHQPSSHWYGTIEAASVAQGVNYFQLHPSDGMCTQFYSYGHYWGQLFVDDGGMAAIRAVLAELGKEVAPGGLGVQCNHARLGAAIDRALTALPGGHATHAEALQDFGDAALRRDFVWGTVDGLDPRSWGDHMLPLAHASLAVGQTLSLSAAPYGVRSTKLPASGSFRLSCSTTDAHWSFLLFRGLTAPGEPFACDQPLLLEGQADLYALAVRRHSNGGNYVLTLAQP